MRNVNLSVPEYVMKELEDRNIDASKLMSALLLDNTTIVELFLEFIQSEKSLATIQKTKHENGRIDFCLDDEVAFIFGCAFPKKANLLDVRILPFDKMTTDSHQDIIDAIAQQKLWSLNFEYDTITNEVSSIQLNWDILLRTDLEAMTESFIESHTHQLH